MSDLSEYNQIPESAAITWLAYSLRVDFYPAIKLKRQTGLEFSQQLATCLEPEDTHISDGSEWRFDGGASCDGMSVRIDKRSISMTAEQPTNNLEWYENRFAGVMAEFRNRFEPELALRTHIRVAGLLPVTEDAISFIGGYVMLMHPKKLDPIRRPLQIIGARFYFPPFEEDAQDGEDREIEWGVDVKIESAYDDEKALFLEAATDWQKPMQWEGGSSQEIVGRLSTTKTFIQDELIDFLRHPPWPEGEDDDADD